MLEICASLDEGVWLSGKGRGIKCNNNAKVLVKIIMFATFIAGLLYGDLLQRTF